MLSCLDESLLYPETSKPPHTLNCRFQSENSYCIFTYEIPVFCDVYDCDTYKGWNFNSGNYLFTTDTK